MGNQARKVKESDGDHECNNDEQQRGEMMRVMMENKDFLSGLSTIIEEPLLVKEVNRRKVERARRRSKKAVIARSM
nr:hypothetical protein CFP56_79683 [Quercus suber]